MTFKLNSLIALVLIAVLAGCSTATKRGGGAVVDRAVRIDCFGATDDQQGDSACRARMCTAPAA